MKATIVTLAAIAIFGVAAFAQEHPEHPKKDATAGAAKAGVVQATVTGENICLACTLKSEKGAAAQCSKYGHQHVLRVASVTPETPGVPSMTGWILSYLPTDKAQPFIKEHHNETVAFQGKVYVDERVLEIDTPVDAKKEHPKKPEHPEHPKGR